jgi:4'-phosphopantetheinyl transferase
LSDQTEAFFNCWTRKEAYVKAAGQGLSIALDSFDVSLAPKEPAVFLRGGDGWSIQSFSPMPGYQAAIVARGTNWRSRSVRLGRVAERAMGGTLANNAEASRHPVN